MSEMTNDEFQMTKEILNPKPESDGRQPLRHSSFVILSSFVIRHSSFFRLVSFK